MNSGTKRELLCSLLITVFSSNQPVSLSPPPNCPVFMHSWDISVLSQLRVMYFLPDLSLSFSTNYTPSFRCCADLFLPPSLSLSLYHSSYSTSCPLPSIFPSINSPLPIGPLSALDTDPISSCPHECVCCHRYFLPDSPSHSPLTTFCWSCCSKRINWKRC